MRKVAFGNCLLALLIVAPAISAQERSGEQIVREQCSKCHLTGTSGAPRIGDRAAWTQRLSGGLDSAVAAAIRGHGGMPARGDRADLTDREVRNAIIFMFNPVTASASSPAAAPAAPKPTCPVKTVGSTEIYLGFLPAELLRSYPPGSVERTVHGGVPSGSGYYHVNVSVFNATTKAPISGARVEVRIAEPGLTSESKSLEPVTINNVPSYGSYVKLKQKTQYVVTVVVRRPDVAQPIEAKFDHRLY